MSFPYLDIILRSAAVYFFMTIALRIFGKKELSQLNTADIILILLISNSVQNAMVGPDTSLWGGLVAALVLFVINFTIKKLTHKYKVLNDLFLDKPEILIHNGKLEFKTLSKLDISNDELKEAMREHGLEHFTEVKLCMLEIDGTISVISKEKNQLKQTHYKRKHNHKNFRK
ncbi:YetF domain-containing protein [Flavobacterium sp. DGU38]|uniref:YetF domain-containing protein n=1 Tax=Flavobacterium calami TaxID=3139144 RepID=A0ABU9IPB9_9FLAO